MGACGAGHGRLGGASAAASEGEPLAPKGWWVWWLFALVAALPLMMLDVIQMSVSMGDEGVILNAARRIAHGQIPFRDFHSYITPGSFYLLAGMFKVFGETLFNARLLQWMFYLATLFAIIGIAGKCGVSGRWKIVGLLATFSFGPPFWYIISHHWICNAFVLVSAWLLFKAEGYREARWMFGAGLAAAAAALTLQDQGGYWIIFGSVALVWAWEGCPWRRLGSFLAGVAALAGTVAFALLIFVPFSDMWDNLIMSPLMGYRGAEGNRMSWGTGALYGWTSVVGHLKTMSGAPGFVQVLADLCNLAGSVIIYLSYPMTTIVLAWALWKARGERGARKSPALLAAVWIALWLTVLHRPAMLNLVWGFPGPLLVGLWFLSPREARWPRASVAASFALALPFLGMGLCSTLLLPLILPSQRIALPAGVVRSFIPEEQQALRLAKDWREKTYREGEKVFCYSYDPAWYFLLRIDNPTRYDIFNVEMNSAKQTAEIMRVLESDPPVWLLLDRYSTKADPVARWTVERHRVFAMTNVFVIGKRADLMAPPLVGSGSAQAIPEGSQRR